MAAPAVTMRHQPPQQEKDMPDTSDNVPVPVPDPEGPVATLVSVSIKRDHIRGPSLVIDCARFQEYLAKLGVTPTDGVYPTPPPQRVRGAIDTSNHKILPAALLGTTNPLRVNLQDYYNGTLTFQQLTDLAYSVKACADAIVEHYRPIEISIRLVEKK